MERRKVRPASNRYAALGIAVFVHELRQEYRTVTEQLEATRTKMTAAPAASSKPEALAARPDERVGESARLAKVERLPTGVLCPCREVEFLELSLSSVLRHVEEKVGRDEVRPLVERVLARTSRG